MILTQIYTELLLLMDVVDDIRSFYKLYKYHNMIKSVIFFRSEFILQVQPPLRSFLPFQASNVSCVGYQRESTQLRFLKGVVSYYTTTTYIKVCALSILHWLHTYITGHWKLIFSIQKKLLVLQFIKRCITALWYKKFRKICGC